MNGFLPVTKKDMLERGWEQADFVYVCGDAYVDHPSFGAAIITRVLENAGFKVAFLAQPDWRSDKDFTRFGRPRLGFLVSSGNIDSMVAHYTVAKKRRSADAYSPGGKVGLRPDRAVIVYCNKIREIYGDIPIIIGGLKRRFAALPTTTIGMIRCAARYFLIRRRICLRSAWASAQWSR